MSEPRHESERSELSTEVNWHMIAAGAGLGAAALAAVVAFFLLAEPRIAPGKQLVQAPPPAAPVRPRALVRASPPKTTPAPQRPVPPAAPELLPPPVVHVTPPAPPPVRVAAAPARAPKETARPTDAPVRVPAPAFRRMRPYGEAEVLRLLDAASREVDLDAKDGTCKKLLADPAKGPAPDAQPVLELLARRDDLKGLPVRMGKECVSDAKAAEVMGRMSQDFRRGIVRARGRAKAGESFSAVLERDEETVRLLEEKTGWRNEEGVPAMVQMLQAENVPVRRQMIKMLASVDGEKASEALARRAVFDTSPELREEAVKALRGRPRAEFRQVLLDGLRYPWAPAAEHAAEALVGVNDQASVFALADMLDLPDPAAPVRDKDNKWEVTELVCVNHLRNCLMCHAPSTDKKDPIRGLVPEKGKAIPELYYDSKQGCFVRADVVYLKQDFSVSRVVSGAAPWPAVQRFDYLTRRRELTKEEMASLPRTDAKEESPAPYAQRFALLWALRELTGENGGYRSEDWHWALTRALFGG
jgi:hypothetical protein